MNQLHRQREWDSTEQTADSLKPPLQTSNKGERNYVSSPHEQSQPAFEKQLCLWIQSCTAPKCVLTHKHCCRQNYNTCRHPTATHTYTRAHTNTHSANDCHTHPNIHKWWQRDIRGADSTVTYEGVNTNPQQYRPRDEAGWEALENRHPQL